jgi:hypothetical protein
MRTTREQKWIANLKHVIDNLIEDDLCAECPESLGIKSAGGIMRVSPKHLRTATYKDQSGTTKAISVQGLRQLQNLVRRDNRENPQ